MGGTIGVSIRRLASGQASCIRQHERLIRFRTGRLAAFHRDEYGRTYLRLGARVDTVRQFVGDFGSFSQSGVALEELYVEGIGLDRVRVATAYAPPRRVLP
jgi:hypothetical protein